MPFCSVCGKENDEQAPFCDNCRAPLPDGSTIGAQPQTDQNERMTGAPRGSARPINHAVLILAGIIVLLCIYFVYTRSSAHDITTTVAGTGTQGYTGDAGPATGAELNYPMGVAFDSFIKAGQIGVLPSSFAEAIAPATGERNIIVQKYEEIDDALVYDSIKETLKMFNEYREYCLAFLAKRE